MRTLKPSDPDPGFPCKLCAVRPDLDCSHRPADPLWTMGPEPPDEDGRRTAMGGGTYRIPARALR